MAQQTVNGVLSSEGNALILAALIGGTGALNGAKMKLYQSSFAPSANSKAADFAAAEANFTGYAAQALTWSAIGTDAGGQSTVLSDRVYFQATDAVSPNVIGGCWIENEVAGPPIVNTAVEFYPFNAPVPLSTAGAFLGVVIGVQTPGTSGYAIADN